MKLALMLLLFDLAAIAQQPQTGPARVTGTCNVANTGTVATVTLNCTGLTPEQQRLLTSVPELLNKLLASQAGSVSEILSKLDTCIAQGAARHVVKDQVDFLDTALQAYKGQKIQIQIYTMVKESNDFGSEISAALKHAGLDPEDMRIMSTSGPVTGLFLTIGTNRRELAEAVAKALVNSKIAPSGPIAATLDEKNPDRLQLTVGFKP